MREQLRLSKIMDMALLYDFYSPLLTEKQCQALCLFYEEDFSLGEIAAACASTRQAAHDLIKRSEALLMDYEQKLGLVARHRAQQQLLKDAEQELAALGINRASAETHAFWQVWDKITE